MKKILIAVVALSMLSGVAMAEGHGKDKHKGKGHEMVKHEKGMMMGKVFKDLPQEKQDQIKEIMKKFGKKEEMKALMEKQKAIISAEKFDKSAYIKGAEAIKDIKEDMKEDKIEMKAEILSILNPEEREKVVKSWGKRKKK